MPTTAFKPARVTVAACTFRRPRGLRDLLQRLSLQNALDHQEIHVDILIVDNEGSDTAREICQQFSKANPHIPLRYRVELQRGISFARNAVIDNIEDDCDFVAMIDDDEIPSPNWLSELLKAHWRTGAQVIRGPIYPAYDNEIAEWVRTQRHFGWPGSDSEIREDQPLDFASTDNTLVQWSCVRQTGLRFEPELAFTGGEDSVFFQHLYQAGNRISFTWKAVVFENIPNERATVRTLLRMSYHNGVNRLNKHRLLQAAKGKDFSLLRSAVWQFGRAFGSVATGLGRLVVCLLLGRWSLHHMLPGLMKFTRGAGLFAGLFGFSFHYYGRGSHVDELAGADAPGAEPAQRAR